MNGTVERGSGTSAHASTRDEAGQAREWNTVVLNDSVNLQSYVTYVFRTHFRFSRSKAHSLMLDVHEKGRAVVSTDGREQAELHVSAMHQFGLNAILEEA